MINNHNKYETGQTFLKEKASSKVGAWSNDRELMIQQDVAEGRGIKIDRCLLITITLKLLGQFFSHSQLHVCINR